MVTSIAFACLLSALPNFPSQTQEDSPSVRAQVRKEITDAYTVWGKARLSYDNGIYEKMLGPDFYAQLPQQKLTRIEFIDVVSKQNPNAKLKRFESQILSIGKTGDDWVAVITEKLEAEVKAADGKVGKVYNIWVTRDGWRKAGDRWTVTFTEAIGFEVWRDTKPPLTGW
jgi:hypothetical protein